MPNSQKFLAAVKDIAETVIISLAIFLLIYIFIAQPNKVDGPSMDPTLIDKQYIITNKLSYRFGTPKRGEIVVFHAPRVACNSATMGNCLFIKRILAIPGDTLSLEEGIFYLNGLVLEENYLGPQVTTKPGNYINGQTVTLGEDEYFVAGDNRADSSDSRIWGPITRKNIVGKAFFTYRPLNRFGLIKDLEFSDQNLAPLTVPASL